jgi:hypothetical protein
MKVPRRLVRPLAAVLSLVVAGTVALAVPAQEAGEPRAVAAPRANCDPGSRPEPSIQGRVPREEVDSGRAEKGYWCNLTAVGHSGSTGGFRVHRYVDKSGHECAYYDTALLFPTNATSLSAEATGVAVLDMSDPRNPVQTETLVTPAMQTPHESLNISVQRGVLAAVLGNPTQYPGGVDVYDISGDCRHPEPMAAAFPATPFGHESGMAPDGMTFYPTSPGTSHMSAVDISNPRLPRTLVTSQYNTHGMSVSDDGRRGYLATLSGLVIVDLSEVQERKPNPQIREISRLTWSNMTIPQFATPVTIDGKPYLIEVDEYSTTERGQHTGHGPRVGAARIIDISDERKPRVVSNIRLGVHQPEHRDEIAGDYGAQSSVQGYAAHYCNVPRRHEPGIVACSMITSGLRVFDIRDPAHPKEIAYFVAPPSMVSETGSPVIDERANWAMSQPDFAPERREIWYSDGTSGFYALKVDRDVWPFRAGPRGRSCLSRRLPIGRRNIGRVRVGYTRRRLLRLRVQPVRRTRRSYRYCVKRSKGRVTAVFSRRGRVVLVTTTARSHGNRRVRPGRSARSLRAYPRRRAFGRGLFRANPRSRRLIGVRRGRVRFIAVANRRLLRRPRTLRRYLRLAGV